MRGSRDPSRGTLCMEGCRKSELRVDRRGSRLGRIRADSQAQVGLASSMGTGMMTRISDKGVAVASKDKGGKSEKKRPQKNLKEKRADKKQKKAK
jgi:hypothetical protein